MGFSSLLYEMILPCCSWTWIDQYGFPLLNTHLYEHTKRLWKHMVAEFFLSWPKIHQITQSLVGRRRDSKIFCLCPYACSLWGNVWRACLLRWPFYLLAWKLPPSVLGCFMEEWNYIPDSATPFALSWVSLPLFWRASFFCLSPPASTQMRCIWFERLPCSLVEILVAAISWSKRFSNSKSCFSSKRELLIYNLCI